MRYRYCTNTIIDSLKNDLNYIIPEDFEEDEGIVMSFIFFENDPVLLNKVLNHLLSLNDNDVTNSIWRYFPRNIEKYTFDGEIAKFAQKREKIVKEYLESDGNVFNKTEDIIYANGVITPVTNRHKAVLLEGLNADIVSASNERDKEEFVILKGSVHDANRSRGTKPSFAVYHKTDGIVGYISLTKGCYFAMRSSEATYNLEYYTLPSFRRKGYMKEALLALMDAIANHKIQVVTKNPMFNHDVEEETIDIRMVNALIFKDNLASRKFIESLKMFESLGMIKYVGDYNEVEEVLCYTKTF